MTWKDILKKEPDSEKLAEEIEGILVDYLALHRVWPYKNRGC